jgi:predicted dehydrogenase
MTVLAAIALHAVRTARVGLGETALVIGLGPVGQLAVSLLRAAGCRVLATDPDVGRCRIATTMGAEVANAGLDAAAVEAATRGLGADAVLVTAATPSSDPMRTAIAAVREKGRVVLVGDSGMELDRRSLYFKEAEVVVSRSYGPGRYDPEYEERGHDYPVAHVRWTEGRNLQAALDLMADRRLDVSPLISHRFPIASAEQAYALIESSAEPYLGIVLEYTPPTSDSDHPITPRPHRPPKHQIGIGVLGAGRFARAVMLPILERQPMLAPVAIASAAGVSAAAAASTFGFAVAAGDEGAVLRDDGVDAVWILTRHHQHARQVIAALEAGKHVFVEKPLCLTLEELDAIEQAVRSAGDRVLQVGFNRRFAPATRMVKEHFATVDQPLTVSIRFNAGAVAADHWTQSEFEGGGRLLGEGCHAIDLAVHLTGSPPVRLYAESIAGPRAPTVIEDQCFITLKHANGSISSIAYLAGGDATFPKERIEVFGGGRVGVIDDFRSATVVAAHRTRRRRFTKDKGHADEIAAFVDAIRGETAPRVPSWPEVRAVSVASIRAIESLRVGSPLDL